MADSKRQQIINKIIARMQLILTTNGYETNLGANVNDWETNYDDSGLPALSVCDLIENETLAHNEPSATRQKNVLPVQLRIFVKSGTRASELRKMFADINKAIAVDSTWDGLAMWTIPIRAGMVIPETDFVIGGGAREIEIHYLTNTFDSY
jgi:hypothetical protein